MGSQDIDGGSRSIAIGCESFVGLQQWLIAHYRCKYIARLDRLWKPQLRTEGHAVGLQLPVPSRRAEYGFQGHRMAFAASAESRHVAMACVGAGASSWHFNAGGDFAEDHARHSCLCDARFPSRPHLAWNCPSLPVPASLQLPTDRAAERLCALPYGCQPPPPPCIDPEGFLEELAEAIRPHVHRRRLYVATDGSSREGVGGMGWAVQLPANRLSTGDALQDQSARGQGGSPSVSGPGGSLPGCDAHRLLAMS